MKRPDISQLDKNRSIYLKLGFIFSLSFLIMAFNYTSHDVVPYERGSMDIVEDDMIPTVRTPKEPKRELPPPLPKVSTEIKEIEDVKFTEELPPEPIPIDINKKTIKVPIEDYVPPTKDVEVEPVILKIDEDVIDEPDEEPVTFAEFMPQFGNCDENLSREERRICSDKALIKYFAENVRYPAIARENGIQGTVVLRFVVDKNGEITMANAAREVSGGCTEEAMRVLKSMPKWKPGRQGGKFVKVYFTMPVRFQLQN